MRVFITGIGGLVGSAAAEYAVGLGHHVAGIDGNHRRVWFGPGGDVSNNLIRLRTLGVSVVGGDIRDGIDLKYLSCADLLIHAAGQTSHDYSKKIVVQDFEVNALATLEILEALRVLNPKCSFVLLSTNKVYGDSINRLDHFVAGNRIEISEDAYGVDRREGVNEKFSVDNTLHTPFGVSKLSADLITQEYSRCFGMNTVAFRCGCLTGIGGAPVELQGFLGYLVRCAVNHVPYTIYGHGGYQVRDNLDARDVASAIFEWAGNPHSDVYNLGGGRRNSISVNEAIAFLGRKGYNLETKHDLPRLGDHKWWISDTTKFRRHYPNWSVKAPIEEVLDGMVKSEQVCREFTQRNKTVPSVVEPPSRIQQLESVAPAELPGFSDADNRGLFRSRRLERIDLGISSDGKLGQDVVWS
jgi:CDP-paratose 2-epimerase